MDTVLFPVPVCAMDGKCRPELDGELRLAIEGFLLVMGGGRLSAVRFDGLRWTEERGDEDIRRVGSLWDDSSSTLCSIRLLSSATKDPLRGT